MHQKYLNLCSENEQRSYRFGTTWGWVINDRIFIFGWTIPLNSNQAHIPHTFTYQHGQPCYRRRSSQYLEVHVWRKRHSGWSLYTAQQTARVSPVEECGDQTLNSVSKRSPEEEAGCWVCGIDAAGESAPTQTNQFQGCLTLCCIKM